jgi:hypothetical protein
MAPYIFVRNADGNLNVPCLNCNVDRPYVNWNWLDNRWNNNEPAGLRATLPIFSLKPYCLGEFFIS